MEYRNLGRSGLKVSAIALGGWITFGRTVKDQKMAQDIIQKAYDSGITFFDIADAYAHGESERMMGAVLKDFPRHTLVISSKLFWPMSDDPNDKGLSRKHIMESVDKSLQRVGTDYLDLYFCHRWDEETPLLETMRAMDDLIHQGKILYWGTSMWTAAQIQQAHDLAEKYHLYAPQVEQPEYNMIERASVENEIIPVAEKNGMGLVTFSPLHGGILTGKYEGGIGKETRMATIDWMKDEMFSKETQAKVKRLAPIAEKLGVSRAQLALAWAMRRPAVSSVITGATKVTQVEENLAALTAELTPDLLAEIDAALAG